MASPVLLPVLDETTTRAEDRGERGGAESATRLLPRPRLDVDGLVRRTEALLAAGIPLSLLLDLADPGGPQSEELYAREG